MKPNIIAEAFDRLRIVNTHCHHAPDELFREGFGLVKLLQYSYVAWIATGVDKEDIGRDLPRYLSMVRHNSYFVWVEKALQRIYGIDTPIDNQSIAQYDAAIREAHTDPSWHLKLMTDTCRYERAILDTFWSPGGDSGHPELFTPTFRVSMFLYGYADDATDHDSVSCYMQTGTKKPGDIDEYCNLVERAIIYHKENGCCALKMAHAYNRTLETRRVVRDNANAAFKNKSCGEEEIRSFQDYVIYAICRSAAKHGLPLQIHTGLGQLSGTNSMNLKGLIADNPDTKFVLFHIGYPWMDDIFALVHNYPNVYPDLCWLPLISPVAAEYALGQLLDIGCADKLFWGCDTWTGEESFAAVLAARAVFSRVLCNRITSGYTGADDAVQLIENVFYNNPKALYGFS
jgi:predicted TIM-barrel fold metal-dependent hydrolase